VDGVFIRDILDNPLSEAIVVSLVRIADVMSAAVVAEYVETDLVIQRLRQHGVSFAQGFGIGKPQPLEDVLSGIGTPVDFGELTSKIRIGT
ncbi:MAG: EAL domain-containing protein, partial [Woeseiaceae bacterium]|nr:EAL domain-containing protein [Woeseiaceae bacterium]